MNKKVAVGLGIAGVAGIVALFAFSGTASASTKRDPWTEPLDLPTTDDEWKAIKTSICTCGRGGAEGRELLLCVLGKAYADVPWEEIVDSGQVDGDHPSLAAAIQVIGALVLEYEQLADDAAREAWCPVAPIVPLPFHPPPVTPLPPIDPFTIRKARLNELLVDSPQGGALWVPQHNVYPTNMSDTARAMLEAAGVQAWSGIRAELAGKISCPQWNAPYKRKRKNSGESTPAYFFCPRPGAGNAGPAWTVTPAYLPRNADARAYIYQGSYPPKTITDTGAKKPGVSGASHYGMLWLPKFDVDAAHEKVLIITEPEPPADFLALLTK